MKNQTTKFSGARSAFTLIELLVVIAVIGVLAAIIFPAFAIAKKNAAIKRIQGEMKLVEAAIDSYKENLGVYPTENKALPHLNPLYYELAGTKLVGNEYQPLSGVGNITEAALATFFGGADVKGFINTTRGTGDELKQAKNCLTGLKPAQYMEVINGGVPGMVLGTTAKVPASLTLSDSSGQNTINPWRYLSSSATNQPGRYDLWVDVIFSGKTNRFSNWQDKPFAL